MEPLENLYFNWLYAKVNDARGRSPSLNFGKLLGELHRIEYVWLISGDDSRAEDGIELRSDFYVNAGLELDGNDPFFSDPCSVLEMMIAFSLRAAFATDESSRWWFRRMLENLGLSEMHDGAAINLEVIRTVAGIFIWRQYDRRGTGGLFPLMRSRNDQREVEVWYQFSEYSFENDFG